MEWGKASEEKLNHKERCVAQKSANSKSGTIVRGN
jgi:hypothetical protein